MMTVPAPGSSLAGSASLHPAPVGAGSGLRPVIPSAPVDVLGGAFLSLSSNIATWKSEEHYANPGPIQFAGSTADSRTAFLQSEKKDYMRRIGQLRDLLSRVSEYCRPGVSDALLDAAIGGVQSLADILAVLKQRE